MMRYAYLRISAEDVPLNVQGGQPLPVPGGGRVVAVIPDFEGETELLVEVAVPADPVPGVHDPDRPVPPDSQDATASLQFLVTTLDDLMQRWLREADVPGSGFELRVLRQRHARELAELIEPHARMLAQ